MKRPISSLGFLVLFSLFFLPHTAGAQNPEVKFIADTLVVQADGTYEADPDLAILTFDISAQEKELKLAYDKATQSMRKIVDLAERNGLKKDDISMGVLTVQPFYEGDRKKRARSYRVSGRLVLRVRDFSKLGTLLDESIQDGIADFRSLTYSLADEEAAKQKAVAEAMKRAIGRASAALEQKGQKVGALRFANLDVKQIVGVSRMDAYTMAEYNTLQAIEVADSGGMFSKNKRAAAPPPPVPQPEKITVSATVQCAFQIQ
ncbi:MAG: SIMPL domain-containing protein [Acidobacteriia bacterium]|nr:SIMPL domain-containing protein [Terriglobia bacterium]